MDLDFLDILFLQNAAGIHPPDDDMADAADDDSEDDDHPDNEPLAGGDVPGRDRQSVSIKDFFEVLYSIVDNADVNVDQLPQTLEFDANTDGVYADKIVGFLTNYFGVEEDAGNVVMQCTFKIEMIEVDTFQITDITPGAESRTQTFKDDDIYYTTLKNRLEGVLQIAPLKIELNVTQLERFNFEGTCTIDRLTYGAGGDDWAAPFVDLCTMR